MKSIETSRSCDTMLVDKPLNSFVFIRSYDEAAYFGGESLLIDAHVNRSSAASTHSFVLELFRTGFEFNDGCLYVSLAWKQLSGVDVDLQLQFCDANATVCFSADVAADVTINDWKKFETKIDRTSVKPSRLLQIESIKLKISTKTGEKQRFQLLIGEVRISTNESLDNNDFLHSLAKEISKNAQQKKIIQCKKEN